MSLDRVEAFGAGRAWLKVLEGWIILPKCAIASVGTRQKNQRYQQLDGE
jgi:hypothetical protein